MKNLFNFFGVDGNKFKLNSTVYEAIEDESDGYRSYLQSIEVDAHIGGIFFRQPLAVVKIVTETIPEGFDGWKLIDIVDGHCWLKVGTDNLDDYYPVFTFEYTPKESVGQEYYYPYKH